MSSSSIRCTILPLLVLAARPLAAEELRASPAARPPASSVELLHAAPAAAVAVSSAVANGADRPAHLVDGKLATAWNSRPGDLVGAWIAFRVPREATVASIRLTAGYSHRSQKGDLFAMNHRLTRLRLERDGKELGVVVLDPGARGLQEVKLSQRGGTFRLTVLETAAGTKPRWREVCVSELEVWGQLAKGTKPVRRVPVVALGALPAEGAPGAATPVAKREIPWPLIPLVPGTAWHYSETTRENASSEEGEDSEVVTRVLSRVVRDGLVAAVISRFPTSLCYPSDPGKVILLEGPEGYTLAPASARNLALLKGDLGKLRLAGKLIIPRKDRCVGRRTGTESDDCTTVSSSSLSTSTKHTLRFAKGVPAALDVQVEVGRAIYSDNCRMVIVKGLGIVDYENLQNDGKEEGSLERFVPGKGP